MATNRVLKPQSQVPPFDGAKPFSTPWYRFFQDIAARLDAGDVGDVTNILNDLQTQITNLLGLIGGPGEVYAPPATDRWPGEMTFQPVNHFPAVSSVTLPTFVDAETPTGAVNGSNVTFTLAHAPNPASSLSLYLNGQKLNLTVDYSLSGSTLTYVNAPQTGDLHSVAYRF